MRTMLIINPATDPATGQVNGGTHWLVASEVDAEDLRRQLVACITDGIAMEVPVVFSQSDAASSVLLLGRSVLLSAAVVTFHDQPPGDRGERPSQSAN